jgi:hypothetical protein
VKARIVPYLILTILSLFTLRAVTAVAADKTGEDLINELQLLYVQSADAGSFDGKRLTLEGVGTTLFFSDRPARVSGHIDTDKFLGAWGADAGADSFASDPPNATLSILGESVPVNTLVELSAPQRNGEKISYAVKVLEGTIPDSFDEASLFIDHHTGNYIATGLGGAILGGALVAATDKPKEEVVSAPPPAYYGNGYYYSAAPPAPCAPCAPCAACPN